MTEIENNSLLDLDPPTSQTAEQANDMLSEALATSSIHSSKASFDIVTPTTANNNNARLVDEQLDSLKLDAAAAAAAAMTNSMTSSYSNKTHELINRTQSFLEKTNFNKTPMISSTYNNNNNTQSKNLGEVNGHEAASPNVANSSTSNSMNAPFTSSNVTSVTPLTGGSTDEFMSKSNASSMNNNNNLGNHSSNYSELLKEVARLREQDLVQRQTIEDLKNNQQEFFQIVLEFEEALKMAEQEKQEREEKLNKEILELTRERDNLQMDVIGVENANKDFQRRFEIVRERIEEFKENEKKLYDAIQTLKQQTEKEKQKYVQLKKHAEEKLEAANNEIDKLRKSTSIELQTLKAELRKAEIKISSLEITVQQKDNENTELTNLLDELLAKVKPN